MYCIYIVYGCQDHKSQLTIMPE